MSLEDSLQRIVSENRKARQASTERLSRLIDSTVAGDELTEVLDEIDGRDSVKALGPDESSKGMGRGDSAQETTEGVGPAGTEFGSRG